MDGFAPQPPPRRGEWRWHVREAEQSADAYRAARRPVRGEIRIRPAEGAATPELLERMRAYAEAWFGLPARVTAPIAGLDEARHPQRGQTNAAMVLARMADAVEPGAAVTIAVLSDDLFAPGIRWLFGQANLLSGCAAISLARYGHPDPRVFLRRALKLLSHEGAHALGLAHCLRWRCAMQGANSLEEDDAHPMHLCPDDLAKLCWATGADATSRYAALEAFYREVGLASESAWCAARKLEGLPSAAPPDIMEAATGRGNGT